MIIIMKDILFVLCGGARTFINCFDSCYNNVIKQFEKDDTNVHIYFYLKLTDPGPKQQEAKWQFTYKDLELNKVQECINKYILKNTRIYTNLLLSNEIGDDELIIQVKNRNKYINFLSNDMHLLRAMHCHYNFESCGKFILKKEKELNCSFDTIIYIRPDLLFKSSADNNYDMNNVITLGKGPNIYNNDHIAIIPRKYLNEFFFDRMNVYRTNDDIEFETAETIYWYTIKDKYMVKSIGKYVIQRN